MSFSDFRKSLAPELQSPEMAKELYRKWRDPKNTPLDFRNGKRCDICGEYHEHAFPIQLECCGLCADAILKMTPGLKVYGVKILQQFPQCPLCKQAKMRFKILNPRLCLKCMGRFDNRARRNHIL